MILREFTVETFPRTSASVSAVLDVALVGALQPGIVIYGGAARSALLEATHGLQMPVRDIDICAYGSSAPEELLTQLSQQLSPDDAEYNQPRRYASIEDVFASVDFTLSEAVMPLDGRLPLHVTDAAVTDAKSRIVRITEARIKQTIALGNTDEEAAQKQYLRNRTNLPARAAYLTALFRSNGVDFTTELGDHPRPAGPEDAHTFFLGLAVRKALQLDQMVRGEGDITVSTLLIEELGALGLTRAAKPGRVEDIVKFCEQIHEQHPHLKFFGSKVASMVRHTGPQPGQD